MSTNVASQLGSPRALRCVVLTALLTLSATVASPQTINSSASFLTFDTAAQGNWKGAYGADGSVLAGVPSQNVPSYATFQVQNQGNYTWDSSPSDPRALETGSGTATIAACWYSPTTFTFDFNFVDGNTHQLALYAVDWDSSGRAETIQIVDENSGNQLDFRTLSNFSAGAYLVWNISGHVRINVTSTGGTNAVVSGVFFGPVSSAAVATFLAQDTSTEGNWQGTYGGDGIALANVLPQNVPSYARFQVQNQGNYSWDLNPSSSRALETGTGTARIAACWYTQPSSSYILDVNFTDGNTHQFALYAVDWDSAGRADTIQVIDANTGNQLDLRTLSNFSSGAYLVWNMSGHVRINVTSTGGTNAVISGALLGTGSVGATGAPAGGTTTSINTPPAIPSIHSVLLAWDPSPSPATTGYNVYRSNISGTGYAKISPTPVFGLTYSDTNVVSGQIYYYVVAAADSSGDQSAFSNEIEEVVP